MGQICDTLQGPVHLHMYDTLRQGESNEARSTQQAVDACYKSEADRASAWSTTGCRSLP